MVDFHIQHMILVANPKKLPFYTVANPARGLLNREKRTKEKIWQRPPPPHPARSEKIHKNNLMHLQALRRSRSVTRPLQEFLRLVDLVKGCRFAKFYASVCDSKFPSLVAFLSSSGDV